MTGRMLGEGGVLQKSNMARGGAMFWIGACFWGDYQHMAAKVSNARNRILILWGLAMSITSVFTTALMLSASLV